MIGRKWGVGKPTIRGGWSYPVGSKVIKDVLFDWLPDLLDYILHEPFFVEIVVLVEWTAFLSPTAKVYSPVLTERKTYRNNSDELLFDFVEGNDPHWMNLSKEVIAVPLKLSSIYYTYMYDYNNINGRMHLQAIYFGLRVE